jgi:type II secretory pathway component GspD/PulD (secretin)
MSGRVWLGLTLEKTKRMKSKIIVLMLVGLLAGSLAVSAQTTDATVETATPVAVVGTPQAGAIIPLIVMDEVPLNDAIKNLARQAGLNYMLDPRMNFGQPGTDGRPAAQPTVSIRWENITAEQALMSLLGNYGLQMVEDPKTKIARISVKDPAAPEPLSTKIIQLKYADPKDMVIAVQTALTDDKRSKVVADIRTSQLVVLATEKQFTAIDELILRLDSPTKQVLIECKIYETSASPSSMKGIDWTGTLGAQNFSFGNGVLSGSSTFNNSGVPISSAPVTTTTTEPGGRVISTTTPGVTTPARTIKSTVLSSLIGNGGLSFNTAKGLMPATFFLNADGVKGVLSFLNSDTDTRIISSPRAVTLDNQTAILSVTRATPIFNSTAGTQGSPGGSSVTYSNLGTILIVTPRISANNDIQLRVIPEVSSDAGASKPVLVAGVLNQAEMFDIRRIETQVLIPSGTTLVLGGLMSDNTTKGYTKVPLMGDIPGVGFFFRSKSKQLFMKNLIIFITPTIVTPDAFRPTKTDFLDSTVEDRPYKEPGAWDSAKPYDWSKSNAASKEEATFNESADASKKPAVPAPKNP